MAETATNTRPSRARKAAPAAAAKATPAKAAAPAAAKAEAASTETVDRFTVAFEHVGTTKNFERFNAPDSMKGVVAGSVYAPLGTTRVGVVIIGVEAPAAE